jgi:probable F420-dependent oxidoreductase
VRFSLGLPVEYPDQFDELCSGEALVEMARAAEAAGFDAVSVTDHPFPQDKWLRAGGHHTYEPLVALAYVASATSTIKLQTNVFVAAYRNAFLAAKGVASLDALSGGRLILGVAAGYLEPEFTVLGSNFERRNDMLDESIQAMKAAWTGESVTFDGEFYKADGHTMRPPPLQQPGPPIWIGGNSTRAIRRAVELADGWLPFPQPQGASKYTRTPNINTMEELRGRIGRARELADEAGRTAPLDVCFVPFGLTLFDRPVQDFKGTAQQLPDLADAGVTWLSIQFRVKTRKEFMAQIEQFADEVIQPSRAAQ